MLSDTKSPSPSDGPRDTSMELRQNSVRRRELRTKPKDARTELAAVKAQASQGTDEAAGILHLNINIDDQQPCVQIATEMEGNHDSNK